MKTLLLTGVNGLLGQKIVEYGTDKYKIIGLGRRVNPLPSPTGYHRIDITRRNQLVCLLEEINPQFLINTAAMTNVDLCETEKEQARKINTEAVEVIAEICGKIGTKLIQISTDYVFNGENGPYKEEDLPGPINYYGQTKLESEKITLQASKENLVVRTMVLYGCASGGRMNFVSQVIENLKNQRPVRAATDQFGTPTLVDDLAQALLKLCQAGATGLFHFAGGDFLNRYQMAKITAEEFNLPVSLIKPVTTSQLGQKAPRPIKSGLRSEKIQGKFGIKPTRFKEGLRIMAKQMGFSK